MSVLTFLPLVFIAFIGVSLVGFVVLVLAVRGQPVFSSPRCTKCSYDLRTLPFMSPEQLGACPECGATLGQIGAVSFGRWQRRPRRIVFGVVLLALPWAVAVPVTFFARQSAISRMGGPQARASQSNATILANLPKTIDTPWDWQELERRLKNGTLSAQETNLAIGALITHLNAKRAGGKPQQPLHWAGNFIRAASASGNVAPEQLKALCTAFYGSSPQVTVRQRARQDEPLLVESRSDSSWNLEGQQMYWSLTGVVADGATKLTPQLRHDNRPEAKHPDHFSATANGYMSLNLPQSLPPGEHELAFTYEFGVVSDQSIARGIDGKPGTPDKWPTPLARWQGVVKRKIRVVPKEQPVVTMLTDPAADPFRTFKLSVSDALARPASGGVEIAFKWKLDGKPSVPLAYRVWIQAGDQKVDFGSFAHYATRNGTTSSYGDRTRIKTLPASVTSIDLTLVPEAKVAEQFGEVEQVWGKPLEIKDIPLQRFDLKFSKPEIATTNPSRNGGS